MADVGADGEDNAPATDASSMLLALGNAQLTLDPPPLIEPFQGYDTEQRQFVIPDNNDHTFKSEFTTPTPTLTVADGSNEKIDSNTSETYPSQSSPQANENDIVQQNNGETIAKSEKQEEVSPDELTKNDKDTIADKDTSKVSAQGVKKRKKRIKEESSPSKNNKEIIIEPKKRMSKKRRKELLEQIEDGTAKAKRAVPATPFICCVGTCEKKFPTQLSLANHEARHLRAQDRLNTRCAQCCKTYSSRNALLTHMKTHSETKAFTCDICGKGFAQRPNFDRHKKNAHSTEKPHACEVCEKAFADKYALKQHVKIHVQVKTYQCGTCGKMFKGSQNLKHHEKMHLDVEQRAHKCIVCNKAFYQSSGLQRHLRTHSGAKPFVCSVCDRAFGDQSVLKNHMYIHSEHKPHTCRICGKAFIKVTRFKRHMAEHEGLSHTSQSQSSTNSRDDCMMNNNIPQQPVWNTQKEAFENGASFLHEENVPVMHGQDLPPHLNELERSGVAAGGASEGFDYESINASLQYMTTNHGQLAVMGGYGDDHRNNRERLHDPESKIRNQQQHYALYQENLHNVFPNARQDHHNQQQQQQHRYGIQGFQQVKPRYHPYQESQSAGKMQMLPPREGASSSENPTPSVPGNSNGNYAKPVTTPHSTCEQFTEFKLETKTTETKNAVAKPSVTDDDQKDYDDDRKDYEHDLYDDDDDDDDAREEVSADNEVSSDAVQLVEDLHTCPHCMLVFESKSELEKHPCEMDSDPLEETKKKRKKRQSRKCLNCKEKFPTHAEMLTHKETCTVQKHNIYACQICDQTYKQKVNLQRHESSAHKIGDATAMCPECGKTFYDKYALTQHMVSHRTECSFQCKTCGKLFKGSQHLRHHERSHLTILPFKCSMCEKSFYQNGALKRHERTHTGDKPYECETCHRTFADQTSLRNHRYVHYDAATGNTSLSKPYLCDACGKGFVKKGRYRDHVDNGKCPASNGKTTKISEETLVNEMKGNGRFFLLDEVFRSGSVSTNPTVTSVRKKSGDVVFASDEKYPPAPAQISSGYNLSVFPTNSQPDFNATSESSSNNHQTPSMQTNDPSFPLYQVQHLEFNKSLGLMQNSALNHQTAHSHSHSHTSHQSAASTSSSAPHMPQPLAQTVARPVPVAHTSTQQPLVQHHYADHTGAYLTRHAKPSAGPSTPMTASGGQILWELEGGNSVHVNQRGGGEQHRFM